MENIQQQPHSDSIISENKQFAIQITQQLNNEIINNQNSPIQANNAMLNTNTTNNNNNSYSNHNNSVTSNLLNTNQELDQILLKKINHDNSKEENSSININNSNHYNTHNNGNQEQVYLNSLYSNQLNDSSVLHQKSNQKKLFNAAEHQDMQLKFFRNDSNVSIPDSYKEGFKRKISNISPNLQLKGCQDKSDISNSISQPKLSKLSLHNPINQKQRNMFRKQSISNPNIYTSDESQSPNKLDFPKYDVVKQSTINQTQYNYNTQLVLNSQRTCKKQSPPQNAVKDSSQTCIQNSNQNIPEKVPQNLNVSKNLTLFIRISRVFRYFMNKTSARRFQNFTDKNRKIINDWSHFKIKQSQNDFLSIQHAQQKSQENIEKNNQINNQLAIHNQQSTATNLNTSPQKDARHQFRKQLGLSSMKTLKPQRKNSDNSKQSFCQEIEKMWIYRCTAIQRKLQKIPILQPTHKIPMLLNFMMSLIIMFNFFIFSVHITFDMNLDSKAYYLIDVICIATTFMHMMFQINVGFYQKGRVIQQRYLIFKHYKQSIFKSDIIGLSILIFRVMKKDRSLITFLLESLYFVQIKTLKKLVMRIERIYINAGKSSYLYSLSKLLASGVFLSHFIGIAWHGLAVIEIQYFNVDKNWIEELGVTGTVWYVQYMYSFYWATSTMMLVGPFGYNFFEVLFTTITLFITVGVFAYIISEIGQILQDMNLKDQNYKSDLKAINQYMNTRQISLQLKGSVQNYLEYLFDCHETMISNDESKKVLLKLPPILQENLKIEISKIILQKFKEFTLLFSEETQQNIVKVLEEMHFIPSQSVFRQAKHEDLAIYFLAQGDVNIQYKDQFKNQASVIKTIKEGEIFGDLNFFTGQDYEYQALCTSPCTIYRIKRSEFIKLIQNISIDKQRFFHIKDDFIINNRSYFYPRKCIICTQQTHQETYCNQINYNPDRYFLVCKYEYSQEQPRGTYQQYDIPERSYFKLNAIGSFFIITQGQHELQKKFEIIGEKVSRDIVLKQNEEEIYKKIECILEQMTEQLQIRDNNVSEYDDGLFNNGTIMEEDEDDEEEEEEEDIEIDISEQIDQSNRTNINQNNHNNDDNDNIEEIQNSTLSLNNKKQLNFQEVVDQHQQQLQFQSEKQNFQYSQSVRDKQHSNRDQQIDIELLSQEDSKSIQNFSIISKLKNKTPNQKPQEQVNLPNSISMELNEQEKSNNNLNNIQQLQQLQLQQQNSNNRISLQQIQQQHMKREEIRNKKKEMFNNSPLQIPILTQQQSSSAEDQHSRFYENSVSPTKRKKSIKKSYHQQFAQQQQQQQQQQENSLIKSNNKKIIGQNFNQNSVNFNNIQYYAQIEQQQQLMQSNHNYYNNNNRNTIMETSAGENNIVVNRQRRNSKVGSSNYQNNMTLNTNNFMTLRTKRHFGGGGGDKFTINPGASAQQFPYDMQNQIQPNLIPANQDHSFIWKQFEIIKNHKYYKVQNNFKNNIIKYFQVIKNKRKTQNKSTYETETKHEIKKRNSVNINSIYTQRQSKRLKARGSNLYSNNVNNNIKA